MIDQRGEPNAEVAADGIQRDQDRFSRRARLPAAFEGAPSLC